MTAASYHLDAWGNFRFPSELGSSDSAASKNRFAFTGYLWDQETALYYAKARFYDPEVGRFTSQDSFLGEINDPPSLHRYFYANANPTRYIDPTGHFSVDSLIAGTKTFAREFGTRAAKEIEGFTLQLPIRPSVALEAAQRGELSRPSELINAYLESQPILDAAVNSYAAGNGRTGAVATIVTESVHTLAPTREFLTASDSSKTWDVRAEAGARGVAKTAMLAGTLIGLRGGSAAPRPQVGQRGVNLLKPKVPPPSAETVAIIRAAQAERAAAAQEVPSRGVLTDANFAQVGINKKGVYSPEGQAKYSALAGRQIQTVDDLAAALRAGEVSPSQMPVDYVVVQEQKVILNTRTSTALNRGGVPREQWYGRNVTGRPVPGAEGITFDDLALQQTRRSKLPPTGTPNEPR